MPQTPRAQIKSIRLLVKVLVDELEKDELQFMVPEVDTQKPVNQLFEIINHKLNNEGISCKSVYAVAPGDQLKGEKYEVESQALVGQCFRDMDRILVKAAKEQKSLQPPKKKQKIDTNAVKIVVESPDTT